MVRHSYNNNLLILTYIYAIACSQSNTRKGLRVPVFGILCDGESFQFFLFEGSSKPFSFSRGSLSDPPIFRQIFKLDDFIASQSSRPFIRNLRQICEITFDLLLRSYISSLEAYRSRSVTNDEREGRPRKVMHEWEEALRLAGDALKKFRAAETMRRHKLLDQANTTAQDAMDILKRRYGPSMLIHIASINLKIQFSTDKVPGIVKIDLIMSDWDDKELETM